MRLVTVGAHGYKRFARKTEMNVDAPVIAIVGPNEAGKTSLLEALERLNGSAPFSPNELTRGATFPDHHEVVWALYELNDEDRGVIRHLPGGPAARWLLEAKRVDGDFGRTVIPALTRERRPRQRVADLLDQSSKNKKLRALRIGDEEVPYERLAREAAEGLRRAGEELNDATERVARTVLDELLDRQSDDDPKYVLELARDLEHLLESEADTHPGEQAQRLLISRIPVFLRFNDAERLLHATYELAGLEEIAPALSNLADLAKLDLRRLATAAQQSQLGLVEELEEGANRELENAFAESWRQFGVRPRLRVDGTVLSILVSTASGQYTEIAERSDGLRAFVALFAYTAKRSQGTESVLLVDEAERHLHYDAQADLVRVFTRQRAAQKVIYTTHSAGCLPEDLGTGLRAVVPDEEDGTSELRNSFWDETPGFSGLLLAMGASALAFAASRHAVIAEGASDMLLLPAILRESTGRSPLGFQVAPGLAEATEDAVASLDLEAARTAYLVDSDANGRRLAVRLSKAGVPDDLIVHMASTKADELVVEDLVDGETYREAVNRELERSHGDLVFPSERLGDTGRPASVARWCKQRGVDAPNKRAVASQVLELQRDGRPIVSARRDEAIALYERIAVALRLDTGASGPRRRTLS